MNITDTNKPTKGAFGVVRTGSFVAPFIRLLTRSQVNHAFVVLGQSRQGEWIILEAQSRGARYAALSKYDSMEVVFSNYDLTDEERGAVVAQARGLHGTPYNYLDIVALCLLTFGLRWSWLLKRAQSAKRLICSQLVDRAYERAGLRLYSDGRPDGEVTPGDLLMHVAQGLEPERREYVQ